VDGLTFVAEIVKALAWPVTVVGAVAMLRQSLLQLIPGMRRFKYKDIEIEFERKLEAAKAEVVDVLLPPPPAPPQVPPPANQDVPRLAPPITPAGAIDLPAMVQAVEQVASVSPRAAVAEAWRFVEMAIQRALSRRQLSRPKSPRELRQVLQQNGLLPGRAGALLDDLRGMRNQAVHATDMELTPGQAIDYALLAATLIMMIDPNVIPLAR